MSHYEESEDEKDIDSDMLDQIPEDQSKNEGMVE